MLYLCNQPLTKETLRGTRRELLYSAVPSNLRQCDVLIHLGTLIYLGARTFHGMVVVLVDRHTTSAAEMIVAFVRENKLATIVGEPTAGRLLSATSVKVGEGYRLALPTGAYLHVEGVGS